MLPESPLHHYRLALETAGFCIIPAVFTEGELSHLRELTDAIVEYAEQGLEDPFEAYYLRHRNDQGVLYDLFQRHPEFHRLATHSVVLDCMTSVLGEDIFLYENSLVYKPPGRSNAVPWHQDFISRAHEPLKLITWTAIDDVTAENGAMQVIPGSHRSGYLPWYRVEGETHHDRVRPEHVDAAQAITVTLSAGDVLIFNAMLLHSSPECHSVHKRRAYRVSYQGFDRLKTPRGMPLVVHGGLPQSLARRYPGPRQKKPFWRRLASRLGKRLLSL